MKTSIQFSGLDQNKEWPHFAWLININGESFTYKTGIGHAYSGKKLSSNDVLVKEHHEFLASKGFRGLSRFDSIYAVMPKEDDILQALFSDTECGQYSFDEFCDNLGYSNDSLKALDIYRACAETAKKLKACLKGEYSTIEQRIKALNEAG